MNKDINRETLLRLYGITEEEVGTLRPMSSLKFSEINKIASIIIDKDISCGHIEWVGTDWVRAIFKKEECLIDEKWDYIEMGITINEDFEIDYFWDYCNKKGTGTTSQQLYNHNKLTGWLITNKFDIFNLNKKED